jgi:deazaflavin-dependent oxidoreductase (nitroreductase family)
MTYGVRETKRGRLVVRTLLWVLVGLLLVVAVAGAVLVVGMRSRSPVVLDAVRRFNRAFTNRLAVRSAGRPGKANGLVRHVGRTSGRAYETPIGPFPTPGGFLVALPYGTRADWLRNVLAAGSATLVFDGETVEVDHPEVVPVADVLDELPASEVRTLRTFGVEQCLRLRRAAVAPSGA